MLSVLSYRRINTLHESAEMVNHTTQVKLDLENIYTSVSEADSNIRGFVLFKDSVYLDRFDLKDESKERITERVKELLARIEEEPKTFGWKMRAKIGDRKRWYDLPEEVEGGP